MQAFEAVESDDARMKALNFILEAWEEGTGSGIAPEMMAYAALYTALTDLVASFGEESVVTLVNGLVPRVQKGEFTVYRSRQ
jgi:transcription initiation factor TFIIIB Brf1 subunit/transcription initiation factor TFIIB